MTTAQSSNDIHFDSLKQCIIYNPPIKSTHGSTFSSNTHQECPPVISLLCYIYCRLFSTGKAKRITTGDATHVFLCFATVYNEFSFTGNAHLYLLLIIYLTWQYHTNKSNSTKHLRIPLPHTPSNFMMPYLQSHHLLSPKHQSKSPTHNPNPPLTPAKFHPSFIPQPQNHFHFYTTVVNRNFYFIRSSSFASLMLPYYIYKKFSSTLQIHIHFPPTASLLKTVPLNTLVYNGKSTSNFSTFQMQIYKLLSL